MRNSLIIFNIFIIISLSACGFHLRGHNLNAKEFAFNNLHLKFSSATPFVGDLQNMLELYKINLKQTSAEAELTLEIVSESTDKQIQALSGAGQVREYQLRYRVSLRAYDQQLHDWLPADEINLQRSLTYDDAQVLAKEQEEALLFRDMRSDAVQQVMRRLSRAKPRVATSNTVTPEPTPPPAPTPLPEPVSVPQ